MSECGSHCNTRVSCFLKVPLSTTAWPYFVCRFALRCRIRLFFGRSALPAIICTYNEISTYYIILKGPCHWSANSMAGPFASQDQWRGFAAEFIPLLCGYWWTYIGISFYVCGSRMIHGEKDGFSPGKNTELKSLCGEMSRQFIIVRKGKRCASTFIYISKSGSAMDVLTWV